MQVVRARSTLQLGDVTSGQLIPHLASLCGMAAHALLCLPHIACNGRSITAVMETASCYAVRAAHAMHMPQCATGQAAVQGCDFLPRTRPAEEHKQHVSAFDDLSPALMSAKMRSRAWVWPMVLSMPAGKARSCSGFRSVIPFTVLVATSCSHTHALCVGRWHPGP